MASRASIFVFGSGDVSNENGCSGCYTGWIIETTTGLGHRLIVVVSYAVVAVEDFIDVGNILGKSWVSLWPIFLIECDQIHVGTSSPKIPNFGFQCNHSV